MENEGNYMEASTCDACPCNLTCSDPAEEFVVKDVRYCAVRPAAEVLLDQRMAEAAEVITMRIMVTAA